MQHNSLIRVFPWYNVQLQRFHVYNLSVKFIQIKIFFSLVFTHPGSLRNAMEFQSRNLQFGDIKGIING
jgi:hypothetical protein